MKYQFCIRFNNIDANSAASKAVLDCNEIFSNHGYLDYTFTVGDNSNRKTYYPYLLRELLVFFFSIKRNSIIGIQYPLLSVNRIFKHFIKIAKYKNVRFFCIVHDLESLRTGGTNQYLINEEVINLNSYDSIIVHNDKMAKWLANAGVVKQMISLQVFDYLVDDFEIKNTWQKDLTIVYAGNLNKSKFIYALPQLQNVFFNVYGPGFKADEKLNNITWGGEYSPEEVTKHLKGSFGLIWDGNEIDVCDEILGNYLKYNNPHKFSLYLAAGLPVIAPSTSAIGSLIKELNIGILIDTLYDLENFKIDELSYNEMRVNVEAVRKKIIIGSFFSQTLKIIENEYAAA